MVTDPEMIFALAKQGQGSFYVAQRPNSDVNHQAHPEFKLLASAWVANNERNNSSDMSRLYSFILNIKKVLGEGVEGEFAELGVYRGNSAAVLVHFARSYQRMTFLFDTFEGFEKRDLVGTDSTKNLGFGDTSLELVRRAVGDENVVYCKGYFPHSIPDNCRDSKFAIVHIDCDLFQPTKEALEFFYPRLNPGGLLLIHDYSGVDWDGIKAAVYGFLSDKIEKVVLIPDKSGTAVFRKFWRVPRGPAVMASGSRCVAQATWPIGDGYTA